MKTAKLRCSWKGCEETVYVPERRADAGAFGAMAREMRPWGEVTFRTPENKHGEACERAALLCPRHAKKFQKLTKSKIRMRFWRTCS